MNWTGKKIHFIGIKGVGMSALASFLKNEGAFISGSDVEEKFQTESVLEKIGITPKIFSEKNIAPDLDLIIYTPAFDAKNIERIKANELRIKELSYGEALSQFAKDKNVIVITGTHGKTTRRA
uniref:UDP-N-acetylmuramate-L-alanine ligase n=1 Tax=Candidatus Giovannonibacteria bacterium GW2011_GWF2_42_19 TaxID=1618659 RepID=A0A0G0ZHU7_9BACT|nr:MAG: UDP-N-acetylmuramate-L-alanine ligase [Candidatus Giovannonibacteria bacterium GW2011_GWF2_42_19]